MSFRPNGCDSDESDADSARGSTTQTSPEPPPRSSEHCDRVPSCSKPSAHDPDCSGILPDFSEDPADDTDEDIANTPLDYGRSEKTKDRGVRIEQRWHKWATLLQLVLRCLLAWPGTAE